MASVIFEHDFEDSTNYGTNQFIIGDENTSVGAAAGVAGSEGAQTEESIPRSIYDVDGGGDSVISYSHGDSGGESRYDSQSDYDDSYESASDEGAIDVFGMDIGEDDEDDSRDVLGVSGHDEPIEALSGAQADDVVHQLPRDRSRAEKTKTRTRQKSRLHDVEYMCSQCNEVAATDDRTASSIVLFDCEHVFHVSCFYEAAGHFRGTDCPICHKSRRFDKMLQSNSDAGSMRGALSALSSNNTFATLMASTHIQEERGKDAWTKLLRNGAALDATRNPKDKLWREVDPNNEYEVQRRACSASIVVSRSKELVLGLLERQAPVEDFCQHVDAVDILSSGCSVDTFFKYGYDLESLFQIGLRDWVQILTLGADIDHLKRVKVRGAVFIPLSVPALVQHYTHNYQSIILFIAQRLAGHSQPTFKVLRRAVWVFCSIGFTDEEIEMLELKDIRWLFTIGGQNSADPKDRAVTAEAFVDLCSGMQRSLADIKRMLKFDEDLLLSICMRAEHFEQLGWSREDIERDIGVNFLQRMHDAEEREVYRREQIRKKRSRARFDNGRRMRASAAPARRGGGGRRGDTGRVRPGGYASDRPALRRMRGRRGAYRSSAREESANHTDVERGGTVDSGSGSETGARHRNVRRRGRGAGGNRTRSARNDNGRRAIKNDAHEDEMALSDSSVDIVSDEGISDVSSSDDDDDDDVMGGGSGSDIELQSVNLSSARSKSDSEAKRVTSSVTRGAPSTARSTTNGQPSASTRVPESRNSGASENIPSSVEFV